MKQYNIDEWSNRVENELEVQVSMQTEEVRMIFTRRELVELKLMLSDLKQYEDLKEQDSYINKADFKNKVELLGTNYAFNAEMGYGDAINDIVKLLS